MKFLGLMITSYYFEELLKLFSKVLVPLFVPMEMYESSNFLIYSVILIIINFLVIVA